MPSSVVTELVVRSQKADATIKGFEARVKRFSQTMEGASKSARRMLLVGGGAIAGFLVLQAKQEREERLLDSALKLTGNTVEGLGQKFRDAADDLQRLTTTGDEEALSLFRLALNMGVAADKVEITTKRAIGLSEAFGINLQTAMRGLVLATQGEVTQLARYIPAARDAADATEALAIINRAADDGFKQAEDSVDTLAGAMSQLKNAVGDTGEVIGAVFAPAATKAAIALKDAQGPMQEWIKANQDIIAGTVALGGATALGVVGTALAATGTLKLISALKQVPKALALVKVGLLATFANPIVIAVAAVAAGIGVIVQTVRALQDVDDKKVQLAQLSATPLNLRGIQGAQRGFDATEGQSSVSRAAAQRKVVGAVQAEIAFQRESLNLVDPGQLANRIRPLENLLTRQTEILRELEGKTRDTGDAFKETAKAAEEARATVLGTIQSQIDNALFELRLARSDLSGDEKANVRSNRQLVLAGATDSDLVQIKGIQKDRAAVDARKKDEKAITAEAQAQFAAIESQAESLLDMTVSDKERLDLQRQLVKEAVDLDILTDEQAAKINADIDKRGAPVDTFRAQLTSAESLFSSIQGAAASRKADPQVAALVEQKAIRKSSEDTAKKMTKAVESLGELVTQGRDGDSGAARFS